MKRPASFIIATAIVLGIFYFYSNDFYYLFELETIKKLQIQWGTYYQENPGFVLLTFFLFNAFFAALPVAGITLISLLGGVLFGFEVGVLLSSTATASGNLVGFLIARYFLKSFIQEKYSSQYAQVSDRYDQFGAYVLFSLRVFPLIPSFVATLVMSLTNMKWTTFFIISWIGRLPMVVVYSYAGFKLSSINSLNEILSPTIIFSLLGMALLPWVFRYLMMKEK